MNKVNKIVEQTENSNWLDNFIHIYNQLHSENLDALSQIYGEDITFVDPVHEIRGLGYLTNYFDHLYQNMNDCVFDVQERIQQGDKAAIYWTMSFSHKKIKNGKRVFVEGHSQLKQQGGLVVYHRDYYDLGEMLYENLPVVGSVVKMIKSKVGK